MINPNNLCQFEGRLTKDPEIRTVGHGDRQFNKAFFTIAVDRVLTKNQRQASKDGDTSVVTADFIPMVANGPKADMLKNYFCKGKPIKVVCTYQAWMTDDGQGGKKFGHAFEVEDLTFVLRDTTQNNNGGGGGNQNNNSGGYSNNNRNQSNNRNNQASNDFVAISDDDIPF